MLVAFKWADGIFTKCYRFGHVFIVLSFFIASFLVQEKACEAAASKVCTPEYLLKLYVTQIY